MELRIGFDGSIAIHPDYARTVTDLNFHSAIGIGDKVECYLDIYALKYFTAATGFCHRIYQNQDIALAWGVHTISYDLDISEVGRGDSTNWKDELYYSGEYTKPFELGSGFLAATYSPRPNLDLTFGIGRGKFVGYGPHSRYLNSNFYHRKGGDWAIGCFLGGEYRPIGPFSIIFDIDARDFNLGALTRINMIEFGIGLTKIEHIIWDDSLSPRLVGSLSYLRLRRPPKLGTIAGTVVDVKNGEPLAADVGFLHIPIPKVLTRPERGTFRFTEIKPGIYEIYARAEDYIGKKKKVKVLAGKTIYVDFELEKKKKPKGEIYGRIFDLKTKEPVVASITVLDIGQTTRCDETGFYQIQGLDSAIYRLKVEAENYELAMVPAVVNAGRRTEVNIGMVKRGMLITIKGVKFDFNKATIKPESYPILDEAAAILTNHPEIRVEVQGHTDSIGSDGYNLKLSYARANAVRRYLIEHHEIDPSRLIARGYGERRPIADNRTKEGRAQNRRVDFLILK